MFRAAPLPRHIPHPGPQFRPGFFVHPATR